MINKSRINKNNYVVSSFLVDEIPVFIDGKIIRFRLYKASRNSYTMFFHYKRIDISNKIKSK